jgi:hypothetical protein
MFFKYKKRSFPAEFLTLFYPKRHILDNMKLLPLPLYGHKPQAMPACAAKQKESKQHRCLYKKAENRHLCLQCLMKKKQK